MLEVGSAAQVDDRGMSKHYYLASARRCWEMLRFAGFAWRATVTVVKGQGGATQSETWAMGDDEALFIAAAPLRPEGALRSVHFPARFLGIQNTKQPKIKGGKHSSPILGGGYWLRAMYLRGLRPSQGGSGHTWEAQSMCLQTGPQPLSLHTEPGPACKEPSNSSPEPIPNAAPHNAKDVRVGLCSSFVSNSSA